jgi:hypothetical protein
MAIRQKTIEYAVTTNTGTVSDATNYTFPDLTVSIPENSSRTFNAVYVVITGDDIITATGGTIAEVRVAIQIDSVAFNEITNTNSLANSGENISLRMMYGDWSSYFQANFTGTSHTVRLRVFIDQNTGTTLGYTNLAAKIVFTYRYDDASATTRIKTAAPGVKLVWIYGNHERRLLRYLEQNAGQFAARVRRDFVNLVRCGGAVWYVGETDAVRIGSHLTVEHGIRYNEHVTKSRLIDLGGQVHVVMGHVHKFNMYEMRGAHYTVQGHSSGCLCLPEPHYLPSGQTQMPGRGWTQGTLVLSTIVDTPVLNVEHARFQRINDKLRCLLRGELL